MPRDPISVLIADDERLISEILSLILEGAGFRIVGFAATRPQTVKLAKDLQPEIVVLDVKLFGQLGLGALPQLKRVCPEASV